MDKINQILASQGLSKARLDEVRSQMSLPASGHEVVTARGHLKILGINNRDVWTVCDEKNMITNTGFMILSSMWGRPSSPETYDTLKPSRIAVGVGLEASPTPAMTRLKMGGTPYTQPPTFISAVTSVVFTGSPNVTGCRFELLIPNGTGSDAYNNVTLQEAGLFPENYSGSSTGAGGMIAYKTYPPIFKTDQFSLLYLWSFTFQVAT